MRSNIKAGTRIAILIVFFIAIMWIMAIKNIQGFTFAATYFSTLTIGIFIVNAIGNQEEKEAKVERAEELNINRR